MGMGVQFLPTEGSVFRILRLLKKNKIVVMIFDQRMRGKNGIRVNFFNWPAVTMRAVSLITMKTGSPVIPVYIWREGGTHIYETGSEIPLIHGHTEEETMRLSTQRYNDILEAFIRKHPEQWTWIHDRWKHRRSGMSN
jgi:KDO2-lipid IV(A) lauroyltransferase